MRKHQSGGIFYKDTSHLFREYKPVNLKANLPEMTKILRERYDKGAESKSVLDQALGSIRTLNDVEQAKVNRVKMEIDEMIGGRVDFENMDRLIKEATTKLVTDHSVLNAIDSYNEKRKEDEVRNQLTAQGKTPLDFNMVYVRDQDGRIVKDPVTKAPVMQHRSMFHDSDRDGIYGHRVEEHLQWSDKAAQLIQGIASDTHLMERARMKNVDPMEVQSWLMQTGGVSKAKIEEISSFLVDEFKSTREGDQMFRALTQLEVNPSTGDLYTPEEAEKKMLSSLKDIGMKQRSSNFQYAGTRFDPSVGAAAGPETPMLKFPAGLTTSELESITNPDKIRSVVKDRGKELPEGKRINQQTGIPYSRPISTTTSELSKKLSQGMASDINWSKYSEKDLVEWALSDPTQITDPDDLRNVFSRKENETDGDYAVRMTGILGRFKNQISDAVPKNSKAAADIMMIGINSGNILLPDGNNASSLDVWADQSQGTFGPLSIRESTLKEALLNSIQAESEGKMTINGQPKGITSLITTGKHAGSVRHTFTVDGKRYEIISNPFNYQGDAFNRSKAISRVRSSLSTKIKEEMNIPGIGRFTVKNIPVTDAQGSRLETVVEDENGNIMRGEEVETLNFRLFQQAAATSGTIWQSVTTFQAAPRERNQ